LTAYLTKVPDNSLILLVVVGVMPTVLVVSQLEKYCRTQLKILQVVWTLQLWAYCTTTT